MVDGGWWMVKEKRQTGRSAVPQKKKGRSMAAPLQKDTGGTPVLPDYR